MIVTAAAFEVGSSQCGINGPHSFRILPPANSSYGPTIFSIFGLTMSSSRLEIRSQRQNDVPLKYVPFPSARFHADFDSVFGLSWNTARIASASSAEIALGNSRGDMSESRHMPRLPRPSARLAGRPASCREITATGRAYASHSPSLNGGPAGRSRRHRRPPPPAADRTAPSPKPGCPPATRSKDCCRRTRAFRRR